MAKDDVQNELTAEVKKLVDKFQPGGELGPVEDRREWEELVASKPPEERELLEQLARFADLWRYFQERKEKLGPEIVGAVSQLRTLPVPERIRSLKEINQKLMERVESAGSGARFRQ
jgi:hypothetical protein